MKVILDEHGEALPDIYWEEHLKNKLLYKCHEIHVSQTLAIDILRSILVEIPIEERPEITWIFYGKEIFFDKNLRNTNAAYQDPRLNVQEKCLYTLIGAKPYVD